MSAADGELQSRIDELENSRSELSGYLTETRELLQDSDDAATQIALEGAEDELLTRLAEVETALSVLQGAFTDATHEISETISTVVDSVFPGFSTAAAAAEFIEAIGQDISDARIEGQREYLEDLREQARERLAELEDEEREKRERDEIADDIAAKEDAERDIDEGAIQGGADGGAEETEELDVDEIDDDLTDYQKIEAAGGALVSEPSANAYYKMSGTADELAEYMGTCGIPDFLFEVMEGEPGEFSLWIGYKG